MNDIRTLRICGIDETRPPRIRKEPYIDLYFRLSAQAPPLWCELFNDLTKTGKFPAKIKPESGLTVDTWVREIDQIAPALVVLKQSVTQATEAYLARLKAESELEAGRGEAPGEDGEQGRLNEVLAALDYGE